MALFPMKNENFPCKAFRFCQKFVMKYAYGSGNLNVVFAAPAVHICHKRSIVETIN